MPSFCQQKRFAPLCILSACRHLHLNISMLKIYSTHYEIISPITTPTPPSKESSTLRTSRLESDQRRLYNPPVRGSRSNIIDGESFLFLVADWLVTRLCNFTCLTQFVPKVFSKDFRRREK
jgi:hypothetical protein